MTRLRRIECGLFVTLAVSLVVIVIAVPGASADVPHVLAKAPKDLNTVINNIRNWLVGLLVALATLFLTVGGVRYLLAGGDPGEVGKAKDTLKYAAIGYACAALAPLLVSILKQFVGA